MDSIPGLGRSPGEEWQPTPVFLPAESFGQRSLAGCSLWVAELDTTERLGTHTHTHTHTQTQVRTSSHSLSVA